MSYTCVKGRERAEGMGEAEGEGESECEGEDMGEGQRHMCICLFPLFLQLFFPFVLLCYGEDGKQANKLAPEMVLHGDVRVGCAEHREGEEIHHVDDEP